MLKKRSSAVSSKKDPMSDRIPPSSPTPEIRNKASNAGPLIPSPGFPPGFPPKGFSGSEAAVMSPTSILQTNSFPLAGRFIIFNKKSKACSNTSSETKVHPWDGRDSKIVGLGIVDALNNVKSDKKSSNPESRTVLFKSKLKVQIPSTSQNCEPHSVIEYGVKNKNSQLAMSLLSPARRQSLAAATTSPTSESSPPDMCLSPSEMELSEDYTRVISHGPNPKTIHIFDTCILERCGNGFSPFRGEICFSAHGSSGHPSDDLLAFCQSCRKKLGHGEDIFMYRGEKAFCSHECRNREMLLDEEMEDSTAR